MTGMDRLDQADRPDRPDRPDRLDRLDGLNEGVLRRALRLEADERLPRFDPVVLAAAAARRTSPEQALRTIRGAALVGFSLGLQVVSAVMIFNAIARLDLTGPASAGLSLLAALAQRAAVLGTLTTDPAVAIAALAAILFAIFHERGVGRESMSVRAS